MIKQLSNSKAGGVFLIVLAIMLNACAPAVAADAFYARPCTPPAREGNVYRQSIQPNLGSFYRSAFSPPPNVDPQENYINQQHGAISLLATQTKRWSDSIDIPLENKFIRITITYISPELAQTIILNHYLFRKIRNSVNNSFETEVTTKMEDIAKRDEHIFFVTLTASSYEQTLPYNSPVIVKLPVQSLVLTNSANIQVKPQHDDHNLEERIELTSGPAHGYISYPLAVTINENCEFLLNKTNNNHIVLSIPNIEVNGTRYETRPWTLNYVPLLNIAPNPDSGESQVQVDRNIDHFRPLDDPPLSINPENDGYWEQLARFIWHEVTLDPWQKSSIR
jgi:hypothetical protein